MNELTNIQNQFGKHLFNFIQSKVKSPDDAYDIYQEVLIKILTKAHQIKSTESLKSWLFMVARNQITDFYRVRKQDLDIEQIISQPAYEEEEHSAYVHLESCLTGLVDQLPGDYKELLIASEINGKSQKELSESLNLNYVTVRSKVQRGRARIKNMILDSCSLEKDRAGRVLNCEPREDKKIDCNARTASCAL